MPVRLRRLLTALVILSCIAWLVQTGLNLANVTLEDRSWDVREVTQLTRNRLKAIAVSLDSTRERVARDKSLQRAIAIEDEASLFPLLRIRDSLTASMTADTVLKERRSDGVFSADRGIAVYSSSGHILAWYTNRPALFGFDSVLSGDLLLPNRDRGTILQNEPIYAYLTSIRKIVSHQGQLAGYVMVKRRLATKEPLSYGQASSFIDDIKQNCHRELDLTFGGRPQLIHSDREWTRTDLYAEPGDPQSYVGSLSISDLPASDPSAFERFLHGMWSLGLTISCFIVLVWLLAAVVDMRHTKRPLLTRLLYSCLVLGALIIARALFASLGGFGVLIGQQFQDPRDFASDWAWGIVQNPFELFITCLFATAASLLLWIIWMPRQRLVRDDSHREDIREVVRRESGMLIVYSIAAVIASQYLTDALSFAVESIVNNGQLRYLIVKQVLPTPPMLMMMLSYLSIGVSYLFFTSLLLTFALRAAIFVLPRTLSLVVRIAIGVGILGALVLGSVYVLDAVGATDTDLSYRLTLAVITLAISTAIILVDAFIHHPSESSPSFLYRLPRSSRSILFILAASALIMSPLIANKQLNTDKDIAQHIVEENAQVDAPELQTVTAHILTTAEQRLDEWSVADGDPNTLRQHAFLVWLASMREHPDWNAIIDLYDQKGELISHFATTAAASELYRVRAVRDSALKDVRASDSGVRVSLKSIPCFTGSCTPAVVGALQYRPSESQAHYLITASIWSDLPALAIPRANFDLLSGQSVDPASNDPLSDGGFIVAQYRPNMRRLTNAPSLDVPAAIPAYYEYELQHKPYFWRESVISGSRYQTLYFRANASGPGSDIPTVITVSVPEPSFARTMEFALRLNAIGLLYGSIVAIVILLIRQLTSRRLRVTLRFRDRIFLVVLLIALVPLVVVTNVTRTLLTERAHVEERDRLARDASVIKDRVARQMESGVVNIFGLDLQNDVDDLAQIIGRDFSIYDGAGLLRASSRPELFESSLLASTMSANAVQEVVLGKKPFFSEPLRIAQRAYQIGYQPIISTQGNHLLGVISLTTMDEQSRIEAEIARTTSFIYGTFAALGLVLLGMGALFAARVASPILALIHATERVAQGKLSTHIRVNREDEIGELMHAFNAMTSELDKSRAIVAQTERELAWKEMARQVAHEIKNPLTPMKLSVQHLEHAHEAKDPNFNSIFRRVIRTLSEQIDVLTRIASEFSRFGEMPRRKYGAVSLRKVAESAIALHDAERSRIRFIIDVPKEISPVHADEEELRRAFVNLIRNAIQAIEGWGVIVVRATQDRGMIHVKLSDTGGGMDEATLVKAFDPNFSTKTSGMGLGLALVKKTITDMSGTIRVESKLGHGTTFYIDLPARGYVEEAEA